MSERPTPDVAGEKCDRAVPETAKILGQWRAPSGLFAWSMASSISVAARSLANISRRTETRKDIGALTSRDTNASRRQMVRGEYSAIFTIYQKCNR